MRQLHEHTDAAGVVDTAQPVARGPVGGVPRPVAGGVRTAERVDVAFVGDRRRVPAAAIDGRLSVGVGLVDGHEIQLTDVAGPERRLHRGQDGVVVVFDAIAVKIAVLVALNASRIGRCAGRCGHTGAGTRRGLRNVILLPQEAEFDDAEQQRKQKDRPHEGELNHHRAATVASPGPSATTKVAH